MSKPVTEVPAGSSTDPTVGRRLVRLPSRTLLLFLLPSHSVDGAEEADRFGPVQTTVQLCLMAHSAHR